MEKGIIYEYKIVCLYRKAKDIYRYIHVKVESSLQCSYITVGLTPSLKLMVGLGTTLSL